MRPPRTNRPGFALLLAVFALAILGALSTGLLFVTTQEMRIARAGEETLHARLAAESAVRATIDRWAETGTERLGLGEHRTIVVPTSSPTRTEATVTLERLAGGRVLIDAVAVSDRGARARGGALVRVLDVPELWASFPAALTITEGGTAGEAGNGESVLTVQGADGRAIDPGGRTCPTRASEGLRQAFGSEPRPAQLPDPVDFIDSVRELGPETRPGSTLGPLDMSRLISLADRIEVGTIEPSPQADGAMCDTTAAGNWGDPRIASPGPCASYVPLIVAPGDLRVGEGAGQGILVVTGDLTLERGASFYGPVLLTGGLRLEEGTVIHGAVTRTGSGPADISGEGSILYSVCSIWRALAGSSLLERPFVTGSRFWVPMRWAGL